MELRFNLDNGRQFSSASQQIRVLTESWISKNMYCPICGSENIYEFENNRPVADFYCNKCSVQYELKSKSSKTGNLGSRIVDGAYTTMIQRITSNTNPNFFFLTYDNYTVNNLLLIPNHFFTPNIIEQRKPLSASAKRAGWVGCNINLETIPSYGKIYIVEKGKEVDRCTVKEKYESTKTLITTNLDSRGWLMDILTCVDRVKADNFNINDIYAFENELKQKYPQNNFIKDKIRQQLQYLRDRGFIEFTSRGKYKKIK